MNGHRVRRLALPVLVPALLGLVLLGVWLGSCGGNRPAPQPPAGPTSGHVARRLYRETAAQRLEEVAADLGQFFAKADSCQRNTHYAAYDLEGWALTIPCNIKVRRLVEEGRRDPDRVAALLKQQLAAALADYPVRRDAWLAYMERYRRGAAPPVSISAQDPTYRRTGHYGDPIFELDRVHYVVHAALYVLAELGRLDARTLAAWVAQDRPDELRCRELEVWLVHAMLAAPPPGGVGAAPGLAEAAARMNVRVTRRPFPRWDIDANATAAALAARSPLEMLDIPVALRVDDALAERLLQQLVASAAAR